MGGRGASSGEYYVRNNKIYKYGEEYKTLLQYGKIKFVKANNKSATAPMETQTKGRIYVTVNDRNELRYITFYDNNNKRSKQIDLQKHIVNGKLEKYHKHKGYKHNGMATELNKNEFKLVERIYKKWYNHINK